MTGQENDQEADGKVKYTTLNGKGQQEKQK